MADFPTPHINATPADFARTVLMPGDPLRSKFIAEHYLESVKLVNNVRGVQGYTGEYKGTRVSVMASGMGIPSIGIYSHELYTVYGVENIMRIGSAGGISEDVKLRDIVIGLGACTDSAYASIFGLPGTFAPIASYKMLRECTDAADKAGICYHVGNLFSTDAFYTDEANIAPALRSTPQWVKMGVLAVEMEAAGLYLNAARAHKNALAICTVSDHLVKGESLCASDRQNTFTQMMELALETAVRLDI